MADDAIERSAESFKTAVLDGDLEAVAALLEGGVDPDTVVGAKRSRREVRRDIDPLGFTALHVAAYEDDAALCGVLLDHGADGARPSRLGWTPIEIAAAWRSPAALRAMLERGVDPDAPSRFGGPLVIASGRGDPELVAVLLEAGARRSIEASITNCCRIEGSPEALALLLDAGGTPPRPDPAKTMWSARVWGLYYRKWACLELLRERTEPATLIDAVIDGDLARFDAHLAAGDDVNRKLDHDMTALVCAAIMGHTALVIRLLDAGAEVDARSVRGRPIVAALVRGHLPAADVLFERGANIEELVTRLIGRRCPPQTWDWVFERVELVNAERLLALAVQRVDAGAVDALLARGADPDGQPGWPPLMHAAWTHSVEIVRALLDAGADPRATDADGRPLMHYVLQYDDVTLDCLDDTNYNRNSPMLRSEAVRLLLDAGAPLPWE